LKKNILTIVVIVLLGAAAVYLYLNRTGKSSIANDAFSKFAIEDTSLVTAIRITDFNGQSVFLERGRDSDLWDVNRTYKARKDAVDLLLKTFKRIQVKQPVADAAKENVLRMIAGAGKMVEIYTGEEEPEKIWYIGTPTPDHFGTNMLLEIPGEGKGELPYVMHMSGFSGILNTRFFVEEQDWRYTGLFRYPNLEIASIKLENNVLPSQSFSITYGTENDLALFDHTGRSVPYFDTLTVKDYLIQFKRVHLESHVSMLSKFQEDSVLVQPPHFVLTVTDKAGERKTVSFYRKAPVNEITDMYSIPAVWDLERLYGTTTGSDLFLVQSYTFGPILVGFEKFRPGRDKYEPGYLWYR